MLERGLLFGLLAFQNDFITREQLLGAFSASLTKQISLEQALRDNQSLQESDWTLLNQLVDRYLAKFENNPAKALEQLSSVDAIREELSRAAEANPEVKHTISWFSEISQPTLAFGIDELPQANSLAGEPGRFRIIKKHAEGGLGIVYVADDRQLRRQVALKQIRKDRADEALYRLKFSQEAEVTGQLEHPGIVPIYALGADEAGQPYYAMRFIRGESLRDNISNFHADLKTGVVAYDGPELRQLLRRFVDVCEAIHYAHDRGVLHRDLKPGNIMLGKYGETLVVDWGLAKPLGQTSGPNPTEQSELPVEPSGNTPGSETSYGQFLGTTAYAPPEQLLGKLDELSPASDVYSLGAVLFELLTGKPPVRDAKTVHDAVEQVRLLQSASPRERLPAIPTALAEICRKALRLLPAERYSSARELKDDVQRWLDDSPVTAYREPWLTTAFRWMRRHQAVTSGMAVGCLSLILLGSGYWIVRSQAAAREAELENEKLALQNDADLAEAKSAAARWQSLSDKANAAQNRGNLPEAIQWLETLQRERGILELDQQLQLAENYFLNQQTEPCSALLAAMDLGDADEGQRAQYSLVRGDLLYGTNQEREGQALLVAARDSGALSPSAQAYVEGVLAATPIACADSLRRCLSLDPFHAMARVRLGLTQVALGQPLSAIETAKLGKSLDAQDWRYNYVIALAYASMGDRGRMDAELESILNQPEAQPMLPVCRLVARASGILEQSFALKDQNAFILVGQLVPEVIQVMGPLLLKSAPETPQISFAKLGWFGGMYEALGSPSFDPAGLSLWMLGAFTSDKAKEYASAMHQLLPENKAILTIMATKSLDQGDFETALALCDEARACEPIFASLDTYLLFVASNVLGMREAAARDGKFPRSQQLEDVARWAEFFATVVPTLQLGGLQENQSWIVWGLLLRNGFTDLALQVAQQQVDLEALDEATRSRWQDRLSLAQEAGQNFNAVAVALAKDPRSVLMPMTNASN